MKEQQKKSSIIDYYNLESPEATEFRRLLHNFNGIPAGGEKRAILVTSAVLSEGKSVIASLLAITAARHKRQKTLLIDFDLRRPTLHRLFSVSLKKGISNVLTEGIAARSIIKSSGEDRLDIITAGPAMDNPSEVISGPAVHRIVEEMKFYYELIVVDSPPLVPVMDPMVLLDELDGAIMVIKAGATQKAVVSRARDLLTTRKDKFMGVVVNNLNRSLPYYYDYGYYGYHHKAAD
ncbi:MAG: CpsD/CapB family tyrosine-protein kinase [Candidatus Zixiibacteriota bacterium]|nr:MAG: CpsD/CapB family tyrosine-protein kinase [candidate division Zixibacteria bacterium]